MTPPPILETPRLILRPHVLADFEASAALWADPAVTQFIGGAPFPREASWTRLLRYIGHWAALGFGYWAITAKEDGRFVGEVGLADYQRDMTPSLDGMPEAGWALKPSEQGRGLASEAVMAMLDWADASLPQSRTACIINPAHDASISVARKAGFEVLTTGRYRDAPTLVLTRDRR